MGAHKGATLLTTNQKNKMLNSRHNPSWIPKTFSIVPGYSNSNFAMLSTNRGFTSYSIINRRTGEFLNCGVTRDHAVKVWNRTGIYGLAPMQYSA